MATYIIGAPNPIDQLKAVVSSLLISCNVLAYEWNEKTDEITIVTEEELSPVNIDLIERLMVYYTGRHLINVRWD